jgi:hypothetical protein
MKKLLAVLFILLVPGLSSGGEEINIKDVTPPAAHRDSTLPDVFFDWAYTCETPVTNCLPDNLVSNPFVVYAKVFVPSTQPYTRHYIVTDIQGAFVGYFSNTDTLTGGVDFNLFVTFSLTPGKLYRFIAIVVGADGKAAVSDPYTFKVVS